jgi:hypothetical protein
MVVAVTPSTLPKPGARPTGQQLFILRFSGRYPVVCTTAQGVVIFVIVYTIERLSGWIRSRLV